MFASTSSLSNDMEHLLLKVAALISIPTPYVFLTTLVHCLILGLGEEGESQGEILVRLMHITIPERGQRTIMQEEGACEEGASMGWQIPYCRERTLCRAGHHKRDDHSALYRHQDFQRKKCPRTRERQCLYLLFQRSL